MITHLDEAIPAMAAMMNTPITRIRKLDTSLAQHGLRTASQKGPYRTRYIQCDALALVLANAFSAKLDCGGLIDNVMKATNQTEGRLDRAILADLNGVFELRYHEQGRFIERSVLIKDCQVNDRFDMPNRPVLPVWPAVEVIRVLSPHWLHWIAENIA